MSSSAPIAQDRICTSCRKPFRTQWRDARCYPCKYQESGKDACACGGRKDAKSPRCHECTYGRVQLPSLLSPQDAAWAAGLLEAEGTFPLRRSGGGVVRVEMTDQDVVARLYEVLQVGNRGKHVPSNPRHKPTWMLSLARREYIEWLLLQVAPLMCSRRRAAITRLAGNFKHALAVPPTVQSLAPLPDPVSTAWLAGLIEGDGHISAHEVNVTSVDEDVILRVRAVASFGQIYPVQRRKAHHRDSWAWKATSRANIEAVLGPIRPWMLSRRSAAIEAVLRG